ncbi:MAG: outer membrane protein assembly factor BamB [Mariniblastus sp.]|jgi:outer membrane protein assembly factor BamB
MKKRFTYLATGLLAISSLAWTVDSCYAQSDGKSGSLQDEPKANKNPSKEKSVKPGVNKSFVDPGLDVDSFVKRFEIESREVYSSRQAIVDACGIKSGQTVADVGAGTGLFSRLFAKRVGQDGQVFAVDIAPRFIEHIDTESAKSSIQNIKTVLCDDDSVNLPANSADVVFICDTYHHFEYPNSTLTSIHQALKPEGRLIVIDFERIQGKTREWLINHVRAGKEVFRAEIQDAGFTLVNEKKIKGFKENYFFEFRKDDDAKQPAAAIDAANQWNAFRGSGNSVSHAKNLPTVWSDSKNIAWSLDLPGYGQSSPVIWGDKVFTTTMQGAEKETPTVICASLDSGKLIWKKELTSTQKIKASDYVTRSSPTSVVDATALYSFFESGELIATTHEGEMLWQRSLVADYGEYKGNHGIGSSLAMNDEFVFVLAAHEGPSYLLAVDKTTGKNAWKTDLASKVGWSSPSVANDVVLLSVSGTVQGFEVKTGHRVWSIDGVSGNTVASPTVNGNVAYVGSSERAQNFAIEFDASGKSNSTRQVWRSDEVTSSFGSPLYHDGQLYYVNKQGTAYSVNSETGKTTWKGRLSGSCWASPIAAGDKIYFFTKDGSTDVYSAGAVPELVGTNELTVKDRIYGVAVAEGKFVVRTGTRLLCLSESKGETTTTDGAAMDDETASLKVADFPATVTSFGAAVCDGYLYVYGGNTGTAHTYSAAGQNNVFRRIKLANGSVWETLGNVPRRQGNALVSYRNKIYRLGGFEALNKTDDETENIVSTTDFAVYDPATASWTELTPLPEPRSSFDAVVAGDMLYVVGGWALNGERGDSNWHGTAWKMDLNQKQLEWKSMPAPAERRANSLAELNGNVYLIGGMGDDARPTTTVKVFDTKTQTWSDGPNLPGQPMDGFGSSSFNIGGKIVAFTFSGQVVQLSGDGKQWNNLGMVEPGRFFHRLVPFHGNQFLILGGTTGDSEKQSKVLVLDRTSISKSE